MTEAVTPVPVARAPEQRDLGAPLPPPSARDRWLVLTAAFLGWMFDGFEQGLFPLAGPNALADLLRDEAAIDPTAPSKWFGVIMAVFLVGAAAGGVLFGWLGDRLGRVRAMSLSILTYALFTGLCGFATEAWHIAALRFIASLGIGGEWALGVALVNEIWPDKSRALVAGLIGAAANVGFLLVGLLSLVLVQVLGWAETALPAIGLSQAATESLLRYDGWRLLMIAGTLPALLIFFIRMFVPESHKWEREHARGATSHWATRDLLGVLVGSVGAMAVIFVWSPAAPRWADASPVLRSAATLAGIAVALLGFIYPVLRYMRRATTAGALPAAVYPQTLRRLLLGAALAGIALLGTWGSIQWAVKWAIALTRESGVPHAKEYTQIALACGAIAGTISAALFAGRFGRRITYALLCAGSLGASLLLYQTNTTYGPWFLVCVTVAGGVTASFYGFFPLYLPELFRTGVRATAQGFSYNFGRIIAAIGSLQTAALTAYFSAGLAFNQVETHGFPKAASALSFIYLIGVFVIWLGPETRGEPLPE